MLDILTSGFSSAKDKFKGQATLSEDNISDAVGEIRRSLLEADVEYSVAKNFIKRIKDKSLGESVSLKAGKGKNKMKISAGDHFINICQEELENLMGPVNTELELPSNRPASIMMIGLQGAGKTTTTGKLTKFLIDNKKRKPLLVAADIYRPAAVQQLKVLGEKVGAPVFHIENESPVNICEKAIARAYELDCDVIIYDTAGRLTIDSELMQELSDIKTVTKPDNILLVCDAMMGQDAVTTAKSFDEQLDISGVIITKLDGDARGGAALSIKEVTGKPIKFLGMGEELDRIEEFRPEGLASRILGMGDVVGLVQDFEKVASEDAEEDAMRMLQGQFTFTDFYKQLEMIQKMGSLKDVMAKMPMQNMLPKDADLDDGELTKIKAMINSMTKKERINPKLFNESRITRIAKGSGRTSKDVNELLKKFTGMRKMMGMLGKNMGMMGKIPGMGGLSQMNQMRKMAGAMGGEGGGMPDMSQMAGLFGGGGGGGGKQKKPVDRDKLRKMKKNARKARKKNRK
jgi:signal recognition particle subunit SRP54